MNRELEAEYKRLNETEATRWQMMEYSWALKALAEGLSARSVWEQFRNIETCQRYLSEFKGHFTKNPELNEEEANLSAGLHTYMRKGMDSNLSCILYRLIADNRGLPVWYAFVKGLVANKKLKNPFNAALHAADGQRDIDKTADNALMYHSLAMWGEYEDFPSALKWLKGDDHEGEAGTA